MNQSHHNKEDSFCPVCKQCMSLSCSPRAWCGHLECEDESGRLAFSNQLFLQFKLRPGLYRPLLCQYAGNA